VNKQKTKTKRIWGSANTNSKEYNENHKVVARKKHFCCVIKTFLGKYEKNNKKHGVAWGLRGPS
jgi:hypothetical protein